MRQPSIHGLSTPRLRGLPGPVWTMVLWQGGSGLILLLSLAAPMSLTAPSGPRLLVLAYTVAMVAVLLALRVRTPAWLLHAQVGLGLVIIWWLIAASVTPVGRVTTAVSLVALALYVGTWMPLGLALAYVGVGDAVLLVLFVQAGDLPSPVVSWSVITSLSVGITIIINVLVRHLREQASVDPLTGLLNRTGLNELVSNVGLAGGSHWPRSVVVLDIDGLKVVNDRQGHSAGDQLLQRFAHDLRKQLRPSDTAVRSGGDEFLVVLGRTGATEATEIAQRIISQTSVECSFGVAEWNREEPFEAPWSRADGAMYANKADRRRSRP